jgi:cytidine deaminase
MNMLVQGAGRDQLSSILCPIATRAIDHSRPSISNFKVGAAALVRGAGRDRTIWGYNIEHRNGDSLHAEENLVGCLENGERIYRVVIVGQNGNLLAPCGNCREVLISHSAENAAVLVNSGPNQQTWLPLNNLLPSSYVQETRHEVLPPNALVSRLFLAAKNILEDNPYNPYTGWNEAAALFTGGEILAATIMGDAAYHHQHAVEVVLGMADAARNRHPSALLYMTSESNPVFPCGRCRQKLYEAAQRRGRDLPVMAASPAGQIWFSTIGRLLPYAFGPADLEIDLSGF